jgi:hypothetical protein
MRIIERRGNIVPRERDIEFYVVTYPEPDWELGDFFYKATLQDIILQSKGGLRPEHVAGVFLDQSKARNFAMSLLNTGEYR